MTLLLIDAWEIILQNKVILGKQREREFLGCLSVGLVITEELH